MLRTHPYPPARLSESVAMAQAARAIHMMALKGDKEVIVSVDAR